MAIRFANFASTALRSAIDDTQVVLPVVDASVFPVLQITAGALAPYDDEADYFYAGIQDPLTRASELVKVTSIDVDGNTITVERGAEDTEPKSFPVDSIAEQRVTAATLYEAFIQAIGDQVLRGNLLIANPYVLGGQDSEGNIFPILQVDSDDETVVGDALRRLALSAVNGEAWVIDGEKTSRIYHQDFKPKWADVQGGDYLSNATAGETKTVRDKFRVGITQNGAVLPPIDAVGAGAWGSLGSSSGWWGSAFVHAIRATYVSIAEAKDDNHAINKGYVDKLDDQSIKTERGKTQYINDLLDLKNWWSTPISRHDQSGRSAAFTHTQKSGSSLGVGWYRLGSFGASGGLRIHGQMMGHELSQGKCVIDLTFSRRGGSLYVFGNFTGVRAAAAEIIVKGAGSSGNAQRSEVWVYCPSYLGFALNLEDLDGTTLDDSTGYEAELPDNFPIEWSLSIYVPSGVYGQWNWTGSNSALGAANFGSATASAKPTEGNHLTRKDYVDDNFDTKQHTELSSGFDLDTLITTGKYFVVAAVNKPAGSANQGMIEVLNQSSITSQYWREWNSGYHKEYYRTRSASSDWSSWHEYVMSGGDQTIDGSKTFESAVSQNGAPTAAHHLTRKDYVDNVGNTKARYWSTSASGDNPAWIRVCTLPTLGGGQQGGITAVSRRGYGSNSSADVNVSVTIAFKGGNRTSSDINHCLMDVIQTPSTNNVGTSGASLLPIRDAGYVPTNGEEAPFEIWVRLESYSSLACSGFGSGLPSWDFGAHVQADEPAGIRKCTVTQGLISGRDQTIDGLQTFSSNPLSTATQGAAANALTRKDYVDKAIEDAIGKIKVEAFPIGACYSSVTGENPSAALGYGTWVKKPSPTTPVVLFEGVAVLSIDEEEITWFDDLNDHGGVDAFTHITFGFGRVNSPTSPVSVYTEIHNMVEGEQSNPNTVILYGSDGWDDFRVCTAQLSSAGVLFAYAYEDGRNISTPTVRRIIGHKKAYNLWERTA